MGLTGIDIVVFLVLVAVVIGVGVLMSRRERDSEAYFLAGRGLSWWLIGFSLIAANISAEQFVGMSGQAAKDYVGLAIASYEWIAAVTLVAVAFFFLPKFLRSGIYTIPEYLEYRYNHTARTIMSLLMVVTLVCVNITTVIYLGAKALEPLLAGQTLFKHRIDIPTLAWMVGIAAAIYVAAGGLRACAWTDLFWGSGLILGGTIIMVLAFLALDSPERFEGLDPQAVCEAVGVEQGATFSQKFAALKHRKMHMVLPADNPEIPWTALVLGIWIPNFYYWGLNQYIMQRTLGARSLADGQRGVVFAAALKLIIPFVVCIPGIIAFALYQDQLQETASEKTNAPTLAVFQKVKDRPKTSGKLFEFNKDFAELYPEQASELLRFNAAVAGVTVPTGGSPANSLAKMNGELIEQALAKNSQLEVQTELVGYDYDSAFPQLVAGLSPPGLLGFVIAALMGAVVSSLAAMLNAASTIFTMDVYKEYIHREASQANLVLVGRLCVPVAVLVGCLFAPRLSRPEYQGAFHFIQEFQGYISPGVLTVFLFGLFVPRTPRAAGAVGLVLCPGVYGLLHLVASHISFLNRMAITAGVLSAVLLVLTLAQPLPEPARLPVQTKIGLESSRAAKFFGLVVVLATVALYVVFW
ncbi:MAG TPA: sodium:proton symporter [Planctomycetes bacterium]|nr:sodium:proton symporter [Planctomycetota bacterium]